MLIFLQIPLAFIVFQDAIKEHFATFGTVTSVTLEISSVDDETALLFALVNFANRVDAERVSQNA